MAKQRPSFIEEIKDEQALDARLIELSLAGGAWVYSVVPFTHTVRFYSFKNPSSIPDDFITWSRNRIAIKGQFREFSQAAQNREAARGITCE